MFCCCFTTILLLFYCCFVVVWLLFRYHYCFTAVFTTFYYCFGVVLLLIRALKIILNYFSFKRMDTSQSNSTYLINDSSIGDNDVNDIIELEEEIEKGLGPVEQKAPWQRKLTSQVWSLFRKVPGDKYSDNKPRAMCKKCSIEYVGVRNSGIGNLRRHYETCAKFKKCDPVQMMLDRSDGLSLVFPSLKLMCFVNYYLVTLLCMICHFNLLNMRELEEFRIICVMKCPNL